MLPAERDGHVRLIRTAAASTLRQCVDRQHDQAHAVSADAGEPKAMLHQKCQQQQRARQTSQSPSSCRSFATRPERGMIAIKPNHVLSPNILIDPYR